MDTDVLEHGCSCGTAVELEVYHHTMPTDHQLYTPLQSTIQQIHRQSETSHQPVTYRPGGHQPYSDEDLDNIYNMLSSYKTMR